MKFWLRGRFFQWPVHVPSRDPSPTQHSIQQLSQSGLGQGEGEHGVPTKCWPGAARTKFTDGADTPKAKEQQAWHPKFAKFFEKEYPELLSHDFKAATVKHGVVHHIETKPGERPCQYKACHLSAEKQGPGKKAWMELLDA